MPKELYGNLRRVGHSTNFSRRKRDSLEPKNWQSWCGGSRSWALAWEACPNSMGEVAKGERKEEQSYAAKASLAREDR